MRAVTVRDGEVVVAEHPDPEPGAGQVLVRVRAAGLNGADILQRAGRYPAPPGAPPDIPGLELAGEVAALGPGATRFAEGDRVMAIVGGGGQAELATVHERQLMPVPETLDWPSAGAVPEVVLVDRVGVLGDLYALADLAWVGGGFGAAGLHSVLEPAAFGAPVLFGPRHDNSRDAALLQQRGGSAAVMNASDLARRVRGWATDAAARREAGNYARALVRSGVGAAERSFELVERLLR